MLHVASSIIPTIHGTSFHDISIITYLLCQSFSKSVPPLEDMAYQAGLEWQKRGSTDGLVFPDLSFTTSLIFKKNIWNGSLLLPNFTRPLSNDVYYKPNEY
jgi:hypothetical protein